jgi:predicted outer membrane repeat protein
MNKLQRVGFLTQLRGVVMRKLMVAIGIVALLVIGVNATIINIPGDYPTIQEGIDHGQDGDTVLVQPDIYYENLNFNAHNVVLASLFLTTGDTSYISNSIIDGNESGSVITFESGEDSTAQVVGLTIQNGYAQYGGGIDCSRSSPTLRNNSLDGNAAYSGGGIGCLDSSPTIADNQITRNLAFGGNGLGGGICCSHSKPSIGDNVISHNSAVWGGGIHCDQASDAEIGNNLMTRNWASRTGDRVHCSGASPSISYNTITQNSADYDGGGISCGVLSNPTINNNIICENSAHSVGGGIYCYAYSNPKITFNTISGNSANVGGGIGCQWNSNPWIRRNVIIGNSATDYGGGIHCGDSDAMVRNNTISCNSAAYGGGISCGNFSYPTITNTILWGDTGAEIYIIDPYSDPTVTYCVVQGGWPGQGNIDADPIFTGPEREDLHLRWRSPCIDAGDPDFPLDPDGTRSDIGAFYFNQRVPGIVELYPRDTPIVIPPEGGDIFYDGWVFNFLGYPGRVDIWSYAFVPGRGQYGPIDLYRNVRIPADSLGMNQISKHVPGGAPEGDYLFAAYVGSFPSSIIDSSYFYFRKRGSIGGGTADLLYGESWFREVYAEESNLPSDYALSQNYPNPFNATTIISYQLPVDGHVKLEVYNTLGQKVAILVGEQQRAGYKSVSWDASSVSSGIYFYKLTAGDFTETKMMMLVK